MYLTLHNNVFPTLPLAGECRGEGDFLGFNTIPLTFILSPKGERNVLTQFTHYLILYREMRSAKCEVNKLPQQSAAGRFIFFINLENKIRALRDYVYLAPLIAVCPPHNRRSPVEFHLRGEAGTTPDSNGLLHRHNQTCFA
jgi:hypothetical protein